MPDHKDILIERVSKQVEEAARRHGFEFTAGKDPIVPTLHDLLALIPGAGVPQVGGLECIRCGNLIKQIGTVGPASFNNGEPSFYMCLPCATLESLADAAVQVEARTGELGAALSRVYQQMQAPPSATEDEVQAWMLAVRNTFLEYLRRITGLLEDAHTGKHVAEATQVWDLWQLAQQNGEELLAKQLEARFMAILFG